MTDKTECLTTGEALHELLCGQTLIDALGISWTWKRDSYCTLRELYMRAPFKLASVEPKPADCETKSQHALNQAQEDPGERIDHNLLCEAIKYHVKGYSTEFIFAMTDIIRSEARKIANNIVKEQIWAHEKTFSHLNNEEVRKIAKEEIAAHEKENHCGVRGIVRWKNADPNSYEDLVRREKEHTAPTLKETMEKCGYDTKGNLYPQEPIDPGIAKDPMMGLMHKCKYHTKGKP